MLEFPMMERVELTHRVPQAASADLLPLCPLPALIQASTCYGRAEEESH
ncbi:hypothetical protein [Streptomyces sp. MS2.AVA.5]|uniref:Uncharacterized protein n=1 Tax=Streptomyces achmelvichensis TaxID=3134111 RepID=A0ACC6PY69_9ACTN